MRCKNSEKDGVFPKWNGNSVNSANMINYWRKNWDQFKDPLPYPCLARPVVAPWSLTLEVTGTNNILYNNFANELSEKI